MAHTMTITANKLLTALAHDTRLRCLMLLMNHDELCVCELTHAIDVAQPHISRHRAQLRTQVLVSDRRQSLWIHYRINPALPAWVRAILRETAAASAHQAPFADDQQLLSQMPNRPGAARCAAPEEPSNNNLDKLGTDQIHEVLLYTFAILRPLGSLVSKGLSPCEAGGRAAKTGCRGGASAPE